jgi:hypothetical protein
VTLYVDPPLYKLGRMKMCHLWSDAADPEAARAEIVRMLRLLGIDPKHVQAPPAASWLHADICQSKRAAAIRLGALEVDRYAAAEHCARLDLRSRNPAIRRRAEIVLGQVERSRARRARGQASLFEGAR